MRLIVFVLFFAYGLSAVGQNADSSKQKTDTLSSVKVKKNLKYYFGNITMKHVSKSTKFDLQIDTRNSFVKDFPINVYGVNVGLIRRERFRYGVGYYWINQNFNDKLLGIYTAADGATREGRVIVTQKGIPVPVATLQKLVDAGKLDSYVAAAQQIDL